MALGDNFVTVPDLASHLRISDAVDNNELAAAVTSASRWVMAWCDRDFNLATSATARTFQPLDGCLVHVDDISSTTGLIVKVDSDDDGSFSTTWTGSYFQPEPLNGVVGGVPGWPFTTLRALEEPWPALQRAAVQVTAFWGWTEVPQPVKSATIIQAAAIYRRRDSAEGVLGGFGEFGPIRVGTRVDPHVEALLAPYRRMPAVLA